MKTLLKAHLSFIFAMKEPIIGICEKSMLRRKNKSQVFIWAERYSKQPAYGKRSEEGEAMIRWKLSKQFSIVCLKQVLVDRVFCIATEEQGW